MTNKDRQQSLTRKYGTKGDRPYCEFCPNYIKGGGCSYIFNWIIEIKPGVSVSFGPGEPCATAYNRMVRKQQEEGKR